MATAPPIPNSDPFAPANFPGVTHSPPLDGLHLGVPRPQQTPWIFPHSTTTGGGCFACGQSREIPAGPFLLDPPATVHALGSVEVWTLRYGNPDWLAECAPTLERWCARHGYPLRIHDGGGHDTRQFAKADMLRAFLAGDSDWFLFVDADCLVHPLAPSIFEAVTAPGLWAYADIPRTADRWPLWLAQNDIDVPAAWTYRNTGVFAIDRKTAARLLAVIRPPYRRGFLEQHQFNLWFLEAGIPTHDLPPRWNSFADPIDPAWIFHLAGRRKTDRIAKLRANGRIPDAVKTHTIRTPIPDFGKGAVVWPYKSTAAEWDELWFSMRSVQTHWSEKDWPLVLIGDAAPAWWPGEFIHAPAYEDALTIGVQCAETILWMNDDIFLLAEQSPATLSRARHFGDMSPRLGETMAAANTWRRGLGQVLLRCHHHGRPTRNFSTHTPYLFERERSREILREFGAFHKIPFEAAYHNWHRSPHAPCAEKSRGPHDLADKLWINISYRQITPEFRTLMTERFGCC